MVDSRIALLRDLIDSLADPAHAQFHRAYHKSALEFRGLKISPLRSAIRTAFPVRQELSVPDGLGVVEELWSNECFEHRLAALELLARLAGRLPPGRLALVKRLSVQCNEWALLDHLACNTLGPMVLQHGPVLYGKVRQWTTHAHLWTRRASILAHIRPARAAQLSHENAWATFEELLPEREFFIRKAIGWTLRECSKRYPSEVRGFLLRVGERASGLTRKEGARNLPPDMRQAVLRRALG